MLAPWEVWTDLVKLKSVTCPSVAKHPYRTAQNWGKTIPSTPKGNVF